MPHSTILYDFIILLYYDFIILLYYDFIILLYYDFRKFCEKWRRKLGAVGAVGATAPTRFDLGEGHCATRIQDKVHCESY